MLKRIIGILTISLGGVLLICSLTTALAPHETTQTNLPSCGSLLNPGSVNDSDTSDMSTYLDDAMYSDQCDAALSEAAGTATPLLVWGIIFVIAGIITLAVRLPNPAGSAGETPAPESPATPTTASELQNLLDLRDRGILTADEFEAAQRRLAGLGSGV